MKQISLECSSSVKLLKDLNAGVRSPGPTLFQHTLIKKLILQQYANDHFMLSCVFKELAFLDKDCPLLVTRTKQPLLGLVNQNS